MKLRLNCKITKRSLPVLAVILISLLFQFSLSDSMGFYSCQVLIFILAVIENGCIISSIVKKKGKFDIFSWFMIAAFFFSFGHHLLFILGFINKVEAFTDKMSDISIIKAGFWNIYAIGSLYIGYSLFSIESINGIDLNYRKESKWIVNLYQKKLRTVAIVFVIVSIFFSFSEVISVLQVVRQYGYAGVFIARGNSASLSGVISELFLPALTAWYISRNRKEMAPIVIFAVYSAFYLMTGSRLVLVCSMFGLAFYYYRSHTIKRKTIIKGLFLMILGLSVLSFISTYRSSDLEISSFATYLNRNNVFFDVLYETGATFNVSSTVIENCPKNVDYAGGITYLYAITYIFPNAITRLFMPEVESTDSVFQNYLNPGSGIGSSFSAEAFYNFGWLGFVPLIILGIIWGIVSTRLDFSIENKNNIKTFWYLEIAQAFFFIVRSDLMYRLRTIVWCVLPIIVISKMLYQRQLFLEVKNEG